MLSHTFTVKNTGSAPLIIEKVKPGWGCTVANFDKAISPGQEGKVTIKVNLKNKKGKLKQGATIFSNDPQNPQTKIFISGLVKEYISVEPSTRVRFKGYAGDTISKKVTITSLEEQPLKINEITSTIDDKITYTLEKIQEGKRYSLEIKTLSGMKESFQGKVVLSTNSQKKPEVELIIVGKLENEVKVSPQYLYFGVIDTNKEVIDPKSLKRTLTVTRVKGVDFTVGKIEPSSDWITTKTENGKKGKKHSIIITLDKDKLPKGKFTEKLKIHTNYGKASEVATIFIEGKIM